MLHLWHTEPGHPLLIGPVPCGPVEEARIIPIERKADITDNQQAKVFVFLPLSLRTTEDDFIA